MPELADRLKGAVWGHLVGDSMLSAGFDLEDQGKRALRWFGGKGYASGPVFDIGNTTSAALDRLKHGVPVAECGGAAETDNGNGSLMRILPVALVDRDAEDDVIVSHAMAASALTHRHPRSLVACAVYCLAASWLLQGEPPAQALRQALESFRIMASGPYAAELANLEGYTGEPEAVTCSTPCGRPGRPFGGGWSGRDLLGLLGDPGRLAP